MNVKDFCLLKYSNVEEDFIIFHRSKTIRSRRSNPEPIRIALKDETKRIINKWGQNQSLLTDMFSPVLKTG